MVVKGEDVDDVGVVDLGAGPGLHGEVVHGGRIFGKLAPHQLHSHLATEGGIPGAIDRTHTARGNLRAQLILPKHHGHHHRGLALGAGHGAQRREITRDELLGPARRAGNHLQGFFLGRRLLHVLRPKSMPHRPWDKDGEGFSDPRGRRCVEDPRGVASLERAGFLLLGV